MSRLHLILNLQCIFLISAVYGCVVTDITQLEQAIETCKNITLQDLFVPGGQTLALNLKTGTHVTFSGNISFGHAEWAGPLVAINGSYVTIEGLPGSVLDGQGQLYWDGLGEWGTEKPIFFVIQVHHSVLKDIYVLNTPVHTVLLADSSNVIIQNWTINDLAGDPQIVGSGKAGHNTDGFDIWNTTHLIMRNISVYNQDDCIALRCGSHIIAEDFYCYGGHGLSISVGFSNDSVELNTLENVIIRNSVLEAGDNGIHIKTHVDAGNGSMRNIRYENIEFIGPKKYGVNIQQNYRNMPPNSTMPKDTKNNIIISHLELNNIHGSVAGDKAIPIYILCADEGCLNWHFENINITGNEDRNSCNFVPDGFSC